MNCLGQEKDKRTEDSIIKDVRNHFRLKNNLEKCHETTITDTRNHFRLKQQNKAI